jgi:predicted XRE-type DNA-binding protein
MDVREVLAAQTEMYGEPLGQRIGRLLTTYQVSQARLASVLGLSPPMLSQLMSGQRAKISNPAVLGRLVRLEELAGEVSDGPAARDALLTAVQGSRPTLSTGQLPPPRTGRLPVPRTDTRPGPTTAGSAMAAAVPAEVLRRAAGEVSDAALSALLRAAAYGAEVVNFVVDGADVVAGGVPAGAVVERPDPVEDR